MTARGVVYLVGAGPGDPGLLTPRALELIARADVDPPRPADPRRARSTARGADAELRLRRQGGRRPAGAAGGDRPRCCVEHARAGRRVVRLKGGDPFVFGRGGEEAPSCCGRRASTFEVVPGVTAGVAAPAYAGIPVTQRGVAERRRVRHRPRGPGEGRETAIDWPALAAFPGTLVFYMGVRALPRIAERLVAGGRPADEPVAVVERGTLPGQRVAARAARRRSPARAAERGRARAGGHRRRARWRRCASELAWLEARPAARAHRRGDARAGAGERPRGAAARARRGRRRGARDPHAAARRRAARPRRATTSLCVTSPNGAAELFARLDARGPGRPRARRARVAAIGPGTARALRERGIARRRRARRARWPRGSSRRWRTSPVRRALIVRAPRARDVLPDALRARGAEVDILALYGRSPSRSTTRPARAALGADYLTFTSASTVRFFLAAAGRERARRPAARLDRAGHERRAARAGARARPRGRRAHAGRARRRARRGDRRRRSGRRARSHPTAACSASRLAAVPSRRRWHGRSRSSRTPVATVRRGRPRGDRARRPGARVIDITHGIPRHDVAARRARARRALPTRRPACTSRWSTRGSAARRRGGGAAVRRGGPAARRTGQRTAAAGGRALRRRGRGGRDLRVALAAGAGVGDVPRARRLRPGRRRGWRAARRWREAGAPLDPASSSGSSCRGRASRGRRASSRTSWASTASATSSSTPRTADLAAAGLALGRGGRRVGGRRAPATVARTFADVAPGALLRLRGRLRRARARRQPRARRGARSALRAGDEVARWSRAVTRARAPAPAPARDRLDERPRAARSPQAGAPHGTLVTAGRADAPAAAARAARGSRRRAARCCCRCVLRDVRRAPAAPRRPRRGRRRRARTRTVKWPNDVLLDGRKVAGVLAEARPQEGWAVLGIGVNVALDARRPAAGAARQRGDARPPARARSSRRCAELLGRARRAASREPAEATLDALRARDALLGRPCAGRGGAGRGAGIDASGALRVRRRTARVDALDAGEVHLGAVDARAHSAGARASGAVVDGDAVYDRTSPSSPPPAWPSAWHGIVPQIVRMGRRARPAARARPAGGWPAANSAMAYVNLARVRDAPARLQNGSPGAVRRGQLLVVRRPRRAPLAAAAQLEQLRTQELVILREAVRPAGRGGGPPLRRDRSDRVDGERRRAAAAGWRRGEPAPALRRAAAREAVGVHARRSAAAGASSAAPQRPPGSGGASTFTLLAGAPAARTRCAPTRRRSSRAGAPTRRRTARCRVRDPAGCRRVPRRSCRRSSMARW